MFETLVTHWAAQKERPILSLFASEDRASDFSVRADQLFFDYSKTNLDKPARQALLDLASAQGLTQKRAAMFSGALINATLSVSSLTRALKLLIKSKEAPVAAFARAAAADGQRRHAAPDDHARARRHAGRGRRRQQRRARRRRRCRRGRRQRRRVRADRLIRKPKTPLGRWSGR